MYVLIKCVPQMGWLLAKSENEMIYKLWKYHVCGT